MRVQTSSPIRRHESAYTLAEVMVTVLVVGVMLVALYVGFSNGFAVVQATREDLRATQIMSQWMETARLYNWSQINSNGYVPATFFDYFDPASPTNAAGARYTGFLRRITNSAALPAEYRSNVTELTVTIFWTNRNGNRTTVHSRQMQTYCARSGLQNYVFVAK
jgi:Tfp pilus assembly protein PilE